MPPFEREQHLDQADRERPPVRHIASEVQPVVRVDEVQGTTDAAQPAGIDQIIDRVTPALEVGDHMGEPPSGVGRRRAWGRVA
ncbi:MAG: hypothetical protein AW07_03384 [Candidatus Accumulibacter sp. SK-11]|nr:MAG: hypothetical protein AW07_03384 [Candidatus Accumulibacter sp. SK-11]